MVEIIQTKIIHPNVYLTSSTRQSAPTLCFHRFRASRSASKRCCLTRSYCILGADHQAKELQKLVSPLSSSHIHTYTTAFHSESTIQLVDGVNGGLVLISATMEPWMHIIISYTRSPHPMGMETNTDLLARLTFDDVGYTDTMSHSNMSPKPTTQLSTKVTDWVERQALEDREPNATDAANTGTRTTIKHSPEPYTKPRRYDIVTLLQLRYTADLTKIELRVHPSALQGKNPQLGSITYGITIERISMGFLPISTETHELGYRSKLYSSVCCLVGCFPEPSYKHNPALTRVECLALANPRLEQIFKPAPCALYARTQKRSRGVSDVSLNSLHSIPSDEEVIYRKSRPSRMPFAPPLSFQEALQLNFVNRFPRRQPHSPPVNSLAQQHDGFARFLKEHASPPHQRVTAGGRIVPASGPPPVFNVDSLRTPASGSLAPEPSAVSQQNRNGQAEEEKVRESAPLALKVAQFNTNKTLAPENRQASQPQRPTASVEAIGSNIIKANDQVQPRVYSTPQASAHTSMMLADGSHVVIQNGIPYRVYWNGFQTVAEPAVFPFAAVPGSGSMNLQSMMVGPQYSIANPYANTSNLPIALTSSTNGQDASLLQAQQQTPDHVLERLQESLRYELKKLDKHIALRSQNFSALEHASYVAQRKHLVEQMDNIRVSRGGRGGRSSSSSTITNQGNFHATSHVLTSHSVTQPGRPQNISNTDEAKNLAQLAKSGTQGFSAGPPWYDLVNGTMDAAPTPRSIVRPQQETPPARKGLGASSILSPDAPPFVPSNMQGNAARKVEICLPHHQRGNGLLNAAAEPSSVKAPSLDYGQSLEGSTALKDMTISNASKDDQTKQHLPPGGSRTVGKLGMSGSGSALDDVVPVVHQADIAYVDSLGLNPIQEPKLYCSNIREFQEVIRRVREQARLYGCEGGQSKDPEFDAEQDIRWAMADSSPVPLPKKVPDHIVHPRPWNWNDSAFNVRADRSLLRSKTSMALPSQMGNDQLQASKMKKETGPKSVSRYQNADEGNASETVNIKDITSASRTTEVSKAAERDVKIEDLDKRQPSGLTVLEHRSPNRRAVAATRAESLALNRTVDKSELCPEKAVRDDEAAWQELLMKHDAQTALEKKGPVASQVEANMEGIETSKRRQHQASTGDDTESLITSVRVVSSAETNKQGSTLFGTQAVKQEKSTKEWTKEDQAAVDAAYGDPFKRPATPDSWKEVPLPPEILSKVPFKMEDLRK